MNNLITFKSLSDYSRVMKHQWYGRCCFIFMFSTHRTGIIGALCRLFFSSMVLLLLVFIHWCVLEQDSRYTMLAFAFFVFLGCTSITYKQKMLQLNGQPSSMLRQFFLGPCAGCLTGYSARNYHIGISTLRVMHGGMCLWDLIHTSQTHF